MTDKIHRTDANDFMLEFFIEMTDRVHRAFAIVLNTSNELERDVDNALSCMFPSLYPIGPFPSILNQSLQNHLVSLGFNFGIITVMTLEQLLEFSWGLANSKKPYCGSLGLILSLLAL